jgi:hypothetical protein
MADAISCSRLLIRTQRPFPSTTMAIFRPDKFVLITDALAGGHEDIELGRLYSVQKLPIAQRVPPCSRASSM